MTTESTPTETFESKVNEKINEAVSEGERMLARIWKVIAANGVAAILFGFVLVLWPEIGLTTIVVVVALYGAGQRRSIRQWQRSRRRSRGRSEDGCCSRRPSRQGSASRCSSGTTSPRRRCSTWWRLGQSRSACSRWPRRSSFLSVVERRLLLALNGLVAGTFGAVMFIEPDTGAVAIVALIAAFTIVIGVMQVGFALDLRNVAVDMRESLFRGRAPQSPWRNG